MDIIALTVLASTGGAVVTSFVTSFGKKERLVVKSQTKVDRIMEQKELGRWLIMELTEMNSAVHVRKEHVTDLLKKLSVLSESSIFMNFTKRRIHECNEAAITALQIIPQVDRRYMYLLSKLVEGVVEAVLRTSGDRETAYQLAKNIEALSGIATGFRKIIGSSSQVTEWKNEALKRKPKQ
jgi:hypothetical protein